MRKIIWKSTGYLPNKNCCELIIMNYTGFRPTILAYMLVVSGGTSIVFY